MSRVQVQQAPQQAPPPADFEVDPAVSAEAPEAAPQKLTLEQTLRIMDVATALRKEQAVVHQQLNLEETKAMIRERLLDAAKVTGEPLTEEQVNIAIEHYYDKLHVFEEPEWSFELAMAHLYVMRNKIITWAAVLGAAGAAYAWFW